MLGSRTLAMPSRGRPRVSSPQTRGAVPGSPPSRPKYGRRAGPAGVNAGEAVGAGIGPRGEPARGARGGGAEEREGEAGGRRGPTGGESRADQRGAQRTPHQDAAEIVLISIVFRPFSMRCTPVTFTLASVKSTSREFCGSAGLELTGL